MNCVKRAILVILVMACMVPAVHADVIYDNFQDGDSFVPNEGLGVGCLSGLCVLVSGRSIPITVTATGTDHYLDYVALPLANYDPPGDLTVHVRADNNGIPGDSLEAQYVVANSEPQIYTLVFSGNVILEETKTYWVHVDYVDSDSRSNWLVSSNVITGPVASNITAFGHDQGWQMNVQYQGAVRLGTIPVDPVEDGLLDLADGGPLHVYGEDPQDKMSADRGITTGDVNGDGVEDLIMTAPYADGPSNQRDSAGEVYAYFGKPGLNGVKDVADIVGDEPDLIVYGASEDDSLGMGSSVIVGDLNGDSLDDLIIGAYQADGPQENRCSAGEVYVIFGSRILSNTLDLNNGDQDLIIYGAECGDNLGREGAMALGDIDNDEILDLIVAAPSADGLLNARENCGELYFIKGAENISGTLDLSLGQWDGVVYGPSKNDEIGNHGNLTTGDLNGDGIIDAIISAPYADGPSDNRGSCGDAYVIAGLNENVPSFDMATTAPLLCVYGDDSGDYLTKYGALAVGDVNGDGTDDLVLGAPYADGLSNGRSNCGEVYAIFGSSSITGTVDLDSDTPDMIIYGASKSDYVSKYRGLIVGDMTGDGIDEIIAGAVFADGPSNSRGSCGEVYVVYGDDNPASVTDLGNGDQDVLIYGATRNDRIGYGGSMALGDFNGDGTPDLVLASGLADGPGEGRRNCGEGYVFMGGDNLPGVFDIFNGDQDLLIYGPGYDDRLGDDGSLALGDINADGMEDILIGAYRADGPSNNRSCAGEVFGISGSRPPISATVIQTDHAENPLAEDYGTARARIDYKTGDDNSLTKVILRRTKEGVNMEDAAKVANLNWLVSTDRENFSASLEFHYLESEIQGLDEGKLKVFSAETMDGEYTQLETAVDMDKNLATVKSVEGFSSFVIAEGEPLPDDDECFIRSLKSW